jgi:hydroxypyruvate reductase
MAGASAPPRRALLLALYETAVAACHPDAPRIKGGRLRKATVAPMLTLAISDVPGNDPATVGCGPTIADPTALADARAVLARRRPAMQARGLSLPPAIDALLTDPDNETPKPDDRAFVGSLFRIIAAPAGALAAAGAAPAAWP